MAWNVSDLLHYDSSSGKFTWRTGARAGLPAGHHGKTGYVQIGIQGKLYQAHRLAVLYMTGEWPAGQVDHINAVRGDNRWCNLRQATNRMNSENRRSPARNNRSGFLGVARDGARWKASLTVNGKHMHLGRFDCPEAAHEAYIQAKRRMHGGCTL